MSHSQMGYLVAYNLLVVFSSVFFVLGVALLTPTPERRKRYFRKAQVFCQKIWAYAIWSFASGASCFLAALVVLGYHESVIKILSSWQRISQTLDYISSEETWFDKLFRFARS